MKKFIEYLLTPIVIILGLYEFFTTKNLCENEENLSDIEWDCEAQEFYQGRNTFKDGIENKEL